MACLMMRQLQRLAFVAGLMATISPSSHVDARVVPRTGTNTDNSASRSPFTDEFAQLVKTALELWKVPGLSIAVIDGKDVHAKGYGFASLPSTRATPETLWLAGSTTKAFTAACLSSLINSGKYPALAQNWSTTISSILRDDFVLQDQWATSHITLDDAISHRSGMTRDDRSLMRESEGIAKRPKDIVRNLRNLPLVNEPRTKFLYSNLLYITLSHVIETVTGKPLGEVMSELIWDPLGMDSTFFSLEDAEKASQHLASGYIWNQEAGVNKKTPPMAASELSGAAGVISNVLDYAKWIQCLLNQTDPLPASVHQDIRQPRMLTASWPGKQVDIGLYGLGWYRNTYKGHVVYMHDGSMIGYGSQVFWFPEKDFGVVAFANADDGSAAAMQSLSWKLIADKLGIPVEERFDVTAAFLESKNRARRRVADAVNIVFPNRPDPPLPSSFNTSDLAGTYEDPGYGKITLRQEANPQRPDEQMLVAERPEMTWRYGMRFHHVSGDHWIAYLSWLDNMDGATEFVAAEFSQGADGRVSGLKVRWESRMDGDVFEGDTLFTRV